MITIMHGVIGSIMLLLGVYLLASNKYTPSHKLVGRFYVVLLFVTVAFGMYLAVYKSISILIYLGILTCVQACIGIRALYNKKYVCDKIDTFLSVLFVVAVVGLMSVGTAAAISIGVVYTCLLCVHVYYMHVKKHKESMLWLSQHISHMIGTVVSAVTAVLIGAVGILNYMPIFWILPTLVFIFVVRKLRLKYAPIRAIQIWRFKW